MSDPLRPRDTGPRRAAPLRSERQRRQVGRPRPEVPVLITQLEPGSIAAEAYRTLRTNLEFSRSERPCRNIAITSPTAGSGKSTTAANLAVAAAQSGCRVCLVDADIRRPVLHQVFDLPNTDGLVTVLKDGVPFPSVARETRVENLSLVVSGSAGVHLSEGIFASQRLQKVLIEASSEFDLILYDTPPILAVADAANVAALCDGVVLVVRSGSIPPSVLRRAAQQITQVNGRILGVVLNLVNLRGSDDDVYPYYRSYYGDRS